MTNLFCAACRVTEEDGGYTPARFTARQLASLGALHPMYERFGRCAAGVSLSFYTDAPEISFDLVTEPFYTRFTGLDVYENGLLTEFRKLPETAALTHIVYRKRAPGEALLEFYLPANAQATVKNLQLGHFRPADDAARPLVLYYGDSLTQSAYTDTPSLSFPTLLSRWTNTRFINRGVGSLYYDASTLDDAEALSPAVVFAEFGCNDVVRRENGEVVYRDGIYLCWRPDELTPLLEKAEAYLSRLRALYPKAAIYPVSFPWIAPVPGRPDVAETRAAYRERQLALFDRMGFPYVPGDMLTPHLPEFRTEDGTHFNTLGSYACAAAYLPFLNRALQNRNI